MSIPDLLLFPHCDLHMARHGAPELRLRVMSRDVLNPFDLSSYILSDVTPQCTFDFFAPYDEVGHRLELLPAVDPATGLVVAPRLGVYLFVVHFGSFYLTARLQVHDTILGWWFGNSSITTAKDDRFAHSQPSIYASFSDDPAGTDLVGDITGHGYVALDSQDPVVFDVDQNGRLQGKASGSGKLRGQFLGKTHLLDVHVVDYAGKRNTLEEIKVPDLAGAAERHNLVFVAEGFRAGDKAKFDSLVTRVVDEMFTKPRHAPFSLLEGSFNVWKAFEASQQHTVTCAYRVNDENAGNVLAAGFPIPNTQAIAKDPRKYTVQLLMERVGLPLRTETRTTAQLIALWKSQGLHDFDETLVDDKVVTAWKGQKSVGILEARDTFLGFHLGRRYADRLADTADRIVVVQDSAVDANLPAFIRRLYEWFNVSITRLLGPDPRRHAPEVLANPYHDTNSGTSIMQYLASLCWRFEPHPNIGQAWVPADTFKPSRGLVVVIAYDGLTGGAGVGSRTMTTSTVNSNASVGFEYVNAGDERVMRRRPPDQIPIDVDEVINTVAHELGHTFNLGDEYEEFPNNDPSAGLAPNVDSSSDNVARMAAIFFNGTIQPDGTIVFNTNEIDPAKVKWFDLVRILTSSALIKDSEPAGQRLKISIDKRFIASWVDAKKKQKRAHLRSRQISNTGRQLPFNLTSAFYLVDLDIGDIDEAQGTILLGGPGLPPPPFTVFPKGSLLFIPRRDDQGRPRSVVEQAVRKFHETTHRILNKDTDITKVNRDEDSPVDIDGIKMVCKAFKMIGVYEGASLRAGQMFRPTGLCKMRTSRETGNRLFRLLGFWRGGEFCHVCKYLIVNRVDPGLHSVLDHNYYPEPK